MLKLIAIMVFFPSTAMAYQAYWTDALVRRFGEGGKAYDQEILRVGASFSGANKAIWGKLDRIENSTFGPAFAGDVGGIYRYSKFSTSGGIGYSSDFHLRASRLYLVEQRYHSEGDRFVPFVGYVREEYLGIPQSYYDFYRAGASVSITQSFKVAAHAQLIENRFSDLSLADKRGYGGQGLLIYQMPKWQVQGGYIRNCLGYSRACNTSRDLYQEWLAGGHWAFTPTWFLRGGVSFIEQSSRFVAPFSGQIQNSSVVKSELYSLGLMYVIP